MDLNSPLKRVEYNEIHGPLERLAKIKSSLPTLCLKGCISNRTRHCETWQRRARDLRESTRDDSLEYSP